MFFVRLLAGKAFFYFPEKHDLAKKRAVLAVSTGHILVLRCKTCALLRAKTSALLRRKTCAVLRPLPKIRPDLSPARPDVSSDRKSKENLSKIEVLDQKTTFSIAFCNFLYGDLTFVGTSATECKKK